MILYVTEPGAKLRLSGEQLRIEKRRQIIGSAPRHVVEEVVLLGGTQVTSQALRGLLAQGTPLHLLSQKGRYLGHIEPAMTGRVELLRTQVRRLDDPRFCLELTKRIVAAKLSNSRVVLLRLSRTLHRPQLRESAASIARLLSTLRTLDDLNAIRGLEGSAATSYFSSLASVAPNDWQFTGRRYRPPPDPTNALLSFGYSIILGKVVSALQQTGLHPGIGLLHVSRGHRPALALDLVEEFRAAVVDRLVITVISRGLLKLGDFGYNNGCVIVNSAARKRFVKMVESRLDDFITHADGTRRTYREQFLHQARSFAAELRGDAGSYQPLQLR